MSESETDDIGPTFEQAIKDNRLGDWLGLDAQYAMGDEAYQELMDALVEAFEDE